MGLSSSQARLLTMTARMHQIEHRAAHLEAMKLQMANESKRVYDEYLDALEQTKIQVKTITSDGSATYRDLTNYEDFTKAGFALVYNNKVYDGHVRHMDNWGKEYATANPEFIHVTQEMVDNETDPIRKAQLTTLVGKYISKDINGTQVIYSSIPTITTESLNSFEDLISDITGMDESQIEILQGSDFEKALANMINSGWVTIVQKDSVEGKFYDPISEPLKFANFETSVATNTNLQEVSDEIALKKAEARYEANMRAIDLKDRKYDTDLAALEAERNAIKQEMETLKTVAKDNVERTFRLFS